MLWLGVSTKSYLGYRRSLDWIDGAVARAAAVDGVAEGRISCFFAPSFPVLESATRLAAGTAVRIAAQDCSVHRAGPHTGEVAAEMLAEMGVELVEIGHAERRRDHAENDGVVARKVAAARAAGLTPLLCVGELERRSVVEAARFCAQQVRSAAALPGPLLLAYEPVWAIGASEPAEPGYVAEVVARMREQLPDEQRAPVLYGGSAGPGLLGRLWPAVDGLFLGRFAHDLGALAEVFAEAEALSGLAVPGWTSESIGR